MGEELEIEIAGKTYILNEYQVDLIYEYILIVERMERDSALKKSMD